MGRPKSFEDPHKLSVLIEASQAKELEELRQSLALPPLRLAPTMTDLIRLIISRGSQSVRAEMAALRAPPGGAEEAAE